VDARYRGITVHLSPCATAWNPLIVAHGMNLGTTEFDVLEDAIAV